MSDGYGSTQATNTWIGSDGSVTNYDPNTEIGFWISAFHNECDRSAHLEREIELLRELVVEWKNIATRLVYGAEQQIDELRGLRVPYNKAWHDAWDAYDEAIDRGR